MLLKGCNLLQLFCNLIGPRPQMATFHTEKRCMQVKFLITNIFRDKFNKNTKWIFYRI